MHAVTRPKRIVSALARRQQMIQMRLLVLVVLLLELTAAAFLSPFSFPNRPAAPKRSCQVSACQLGWPSAGAPFEDCLVRAEQLPSSESRALQYAALQCLTQASPMVALQRLAALAAADKPSDAEVKPWVAICNEWGSVATPPHPPRMYD